MSRRSDRRFRIGGVLVVVGLVFLLRPRFDFLNGDYFLLLLGLAFLGSYLWTRRYGLMVPAGVLTGLGVGQLLEENSRNMVDGLQLGLGLGFLAVYLVPLAYQRKSHWWPLIPASVLLLSAFEATDDLARYLFENWPIALILLGAILLVAGWLDRSSARDS